ncbi:MAG: hypothetical protein IKS87_04845 [Lachnospiraceae bacterium]|nr:hypothetical protein [Lachnospiraceae bacterium]
MTDPLEELLRRKKQQEVDAYLHDLAQEGAKISVEGHILPIPEAARVIALSEGLCYMPDYQTDDHGKLVEVRFDRVFLN